MNSLDTPMSDVEVIGAGNSALFGVNRVILAVRILAYSGSQYGFSDNPDVAKG